MGESRFVSRVMLLCSVVILGASVRALAEEVSPLGVVFSIIGIAVAAWGWVVDRRAAAASRRDGDA